MGLISGIFLSAGIGLYAGNGHYARFDITKPVQAYAVVELGWSNAGEGVIFSLHHDVESTLGTATNTVEARLRWQPFK